MRNSGLSWSDPRTGLADGTVDDMVSIEESEKAGGKGGVRGEADELEAERSAPLADPRGGGRVREELARRATRGGRLAKYKAGLLLPWTCGPTACGWIGPAPLTRQE